MSTKVRDTQPREVKQSLKEDERKAQILKGQIRAEEGRVNKGIFKLVVKQ